METQQAEKLMKKIEELEVGQARLKKEVTRLRRTGGGSGRLEERKGQQRSHSLSPGRRGPKGSPLATFGHSSSLQFRRESHSVDNVAANATAACDRQGGGGGGGLSDCQYLKILQSMGQSVHIFDLEGKIIYWNRSAEQLYGYSESEAIGQDAVELLVDACDFGAADNIINQIRSGERWTGRFPVKNKFGERFLAIATNTPFYNDDGGLVGIICVSSDSRNFVEVASPSTSAGHTSCPRISLTDKIGADIQQPLSKITTLATKVTQKVRSKIKPSDSRATHEVENREDQCSRHLPADATKIDHRKDVTSSGANTPTGDAQANHFGRGYASNEEKAPSKAAKANTNNAEGKVGIQKILSSKAEAWVAKKGLSWHWKGNEHDGPDVKNRITWPWSQNANECDGNHPKSNGLVQAMDNDDNRMANHDVYGSLSSFNANSTSSASSSGSTSNSTIQKDIEADCLDYEILWEDLTIGEQIGQGSCGTVYHALWYGSDVAVKVFSRQEYPDEVILSFRQEVTVMKRLRHPNILLFMGAVTSPQRLCIVTEFLPRGSLFRLLQRGTAKLDWRRRVHIALDISRGMNYLHHCNPPIIHRDLKSSNLLVDKNWTVKVGDFGLSRVKHESYLTTMSGKGTPQWMAPEVLRNEPSDEKSDVYSFGVILWELVTVKIPWESLNSMQVVGAVGFMDQRLDLPADLDSRWASMIKRCWRSDPQSRPSFQELLESLRDLQRQYMQSNVHRTSRGESLQASTGTIVQE